MAAGEFDAALADHRIITLRENRGIRHKIVHIGLFTGKFNLLLCRILGEAVDDILADGAGEEDGLLLDDGDVRLVALGVQVLQILVTVADRAADRVVESFD